MKWKLFHAFKKAHYLFYFYLSCILPYRWAFIVARMGAWVSYMVKPAERNRIMNGMLMIQNTKLDVTHDITQPLTVYQNFGKVCVDLLYRTKSRSAVNMLDIQTVDEYCLKDAMNKEKGVVLLSAHVGNWEMGAMKLGLMGYPITVLANPHPANIIQKQYIQRRKQCGVQTMSSKTSVKDCLNILKSNGVLAMMGDRPYESTVLKIKWFGQVGFIPKGPMYISLFSGAPIVPTFIKQVGEDQYEIHFLEPIYPPKRNDHTGRPFFLKQIVGSLESIISLNKNEWYIFNEN